jgi:hypothetical protein
MTFPHRPPPPGVRRFFWRQRVWFEGTFGLAMLDTWEILLVCTSSNVLIASSIASFIALLSFPSPFSSPALLASNPSPPQPEHANPSAIPSQTPSSSSPSPSSPSLYTSTSPCTSPSSAHARPTTSPAKSMATSPPRQPRQSGRSREIWWLGWRAQRRNK